jgi:preprotein translocase subunit SecA
VICCQHNPSPRIDRQLHGRCARQGDPGSVETILSLEDTLIAQHWPAWLRSVFRKLARGERGIAPALGKVIAHRPQLSEERRQRMERKLLLDQDNQSERRLSFAGQGE